VLSVIVTCSSWLHRNVQRFRGGLSFKVHRLLYHSTLGLRVMKEKKRGLRHQESHCSRMCGVLDPDNLRTPTMSVTHNPHNVLNLDHSLSPLPLNNLSHKPCPDPLSSEHHTCILVKAMLWPWLSGQSPSSLALRFEAASSLE